MNFWSTRKRCLNVHSFKSNVINDISRNRYLKKSTELVNHGHGGTTICIRYFWSEVYDTIMSSRKCICWRRKCDLYLFLLPWLESKMLILTKRHPTRKTFSIYTIALVCMTDWCSLVYVSYTIATTEIESVCLGV